MKEKTWEPLPMAVWKFPLNLPEGKPGELFEIDLPKGSTILRIAEQGSAEFYLWALVCTTQREKERRFVFAVGTGHEFTVEPLVEIALVSKRHNHPKPYDHQETVLALDGRFVVHFWVSYRFEVEESDA